MKVRALLFLLLAFSLSGCRKEGDLIESSSLAVIEPETTEHEVSETLPELETRKVGDGKSLEELSKESGLPVIETRAVGEESLPDSNAENNNGLHNPSDSDTSESDDNASEYGTDTSESGTNTSNTENETEIDKSSSNVGVELQENNGGDTEVIGIDQEVFNEMQDKYKQEAEEILNDSEVRKKMEELRTGGK